MSDSNDFRPGDEFPVILRKILSRLGSGIATTGGGSGSGGGLTDAELRASPVDVAVTSGGGGLTNAELRASPVPISGTVSVTEPVSVDDNGGSLTVDGPLTDAQLRATAVPVSGTVSVVEPISVDDNGGSLTVDGTFLTDAQLRATPVPISGALTDAELRATPVPVSGTVSVTEPVSVDDNGGSLTVDGTFLTDAQLRATPVPVSGPLTDAQLRATPVPVSGTVSVTEPVSVDDNGGSLTVDSATLATEATLANNKTVGGISTSIKDTTAVSASPDYSIGDAVGGKRTIASAVRVSGGTAILEDILVLDRSNQKPGLEIIIFDADPTAATITDNSAFVFSTDDLKVIARITIGVSDYVSIDSKAIAHLRALGATLKAASGTSLYAAAVATTAWNAAATDDLQVIYKLLQD